MSYTFGPTSGYEPIWDPSKWIVNTSNNNCFSYAFDDHQPLNHKRSSKPVPGGETPGQYSCAYITASLIDDVPNLQTSSFAEPCQPYFHKIFFAVSSEHGTNDFHFWRQDSDGYWSHKAGSQTPQRFDADNRNIINPLTSNRHFESHNYDQPCGYFCIPNKSPINHQ